MKLYSNYLNKILIKTEDPYINKKYKKYVEEEDRKLGKKKEKSVF